MKKVSINMISGPFQHDFCSSALNSNKIVDWRKDNSANISCYIDYGLITKEPDDNKECYGWICESSAIVPSVIKEVVKNKSKYKKKFKYIFTCDDRIARIDKDYFKFTLPSALPWIQEKKIYKKSKTVSFIGSNKKMCKGHMYRQKMIEKYKDKVDHYGRGFNGRELPWTIMVNQKEESGKILGLKDYMFSFAMENTNHKFAFCEKTTDCFATGTIPVYWGGKGIEKYFNKEGIIFLDELKSIKSLNEELYYSKMNAIVDNFNRLKNLDSSEDFFVKNYMEQHL
tara:strand:- start:881 stop:1732 length:852 start_codon:yes stop_codon:yes gene_type:complete